MFILVARQCRQLPFNSLPARQFSTTFALNISRKPESKIRIPSKKAAAAKARRKASAALKEESRLLKLPLKDAIAVLRAVEVASPQSSLYELFVKTEIGNGTAVPRGRVNLPREAKSRGEDKILVFAEGRLAEDAKNAGAHIVGGPELIEGILNNRHRATTILCTPQLIKTITPKLGRFLGPLGLMPSERRGTVTEDIVGYLQRLRGTSEWRADRAGNIRTPIAQMAFPVDEVEINVRAFVDSVKRATGNAKALEADRKLKAAGGARPVTPITKVILSSRQGPGIRIADF